MVFVYEEPSRTFQEFLLLPNLTTKEHTPQNVSLETPLVRHRRGEEDSVPHLRTPMVSAIMQAVSDDSLAIALAREGGLSFIYSSQPVAQQAAMVRRVKRFKAGFVVSSANLRPDQTVRDVLALIEETGHSTIPITHDGSPHGKLLGILTGRDFRPNKTHPDTLASSLMTPRENMVCGREGQTLTEANEIIWEHKLNCLPVVDAEGRLLHLVFRKDYESQKENPYQLVDADKRLVVGAGINSRDYEERVPALLEAGVDVLCVDSSDGFSEWQRDTVRWVKDTFGEKTRVGAGNVVDAEGFRYLAEAGADFIKVGVGPGSICITREQKGIGRGQATAVMEVAKARQEYLEETGIYVPICADGGITLDYHITLALAMGADFVMLGRYFARFDESPGGKVLLRGNFMKEYWGEGSSRARNWQRYDTGGKAKMAFEEGVDAYVPYAGRLKDNVAGTREKLRSTMCNCGALTIRDLQQNARLTYVSPVSIREGGAHDVMLKEDETGLSKDT
ncbi:MAG: IMP dehydrogenase [Acidobacteriota bacterium]